MVELNSDTGTIFFQISEGSTLIVNQTIKVKVASNLKPSENLNILSWKGSHAELILKTS